MDWTVETKKGVFQGFSVREIINDMIEYYQMNRESPSNITAIYGEDFGEVLQQYSLNEISKIQEEIEEKVSEWKLQSESEYRGYRDSQREAII